MFKLNYISTIILWVAASTFAGTIIYLLFSMVFYIDWTDWITTFIFCGLGFGVGRVMSAYKESKNKNLPN